MARFQIRRPDDELPTHTAIWHTLVDKAPEIGPGILGEARIQNWKEWPADPMIGCPEIGYTAIVTSCAFCSLGRLHGCGALDKYDAQLSVGKSVYALIYEPVLKLRSVETMGKRIKPQQVVETDKGGGAQGRYIDLTADGMPPVDLSKEYRPVLKRYMARLELVTRGNAKEKELPDGLFYVKDGNYVGTAQDLVNQDLICNGDEVCSLGECLEFQLRFEPIRTPSKSVDAEPEKPKKRRTRKPPEEDKPKKKKRGRPPKNAEEDQPKKRGRPRKNPEPEEVAPKKKKRGRPRKNASNDD